MRWMHWLLIAPCLLACPKSGDKDEAESAEEREPRAKRPKAKIPDGPVVVVRGGDVELDGRSVGSTRAAEDLGRLQRVDGLFDALEARREEWKTKTPDQPFPGNVVLRCDDEVAMVAFKSVFQTAAYAGYPYLMVETARGFVAVDAQLPAPPSEDAPAPPKEVRLSLFDDKTLLRTKQGATVLSEKELTAATTPLAEAAISQIVLAHYRGEAPADVKLPNLVIEAQTAKVRALRVTLAALEAARTELATKDKRLPFAVFFSIVDGSGSPAASASGSAAPAESESEVSGRLPREVIQRIVRQSFGALRRCYSAGLASNPNLRGRVGVRFVIGRDGHVSSAKDDGGDLPDKAVRDCVVAAFLKLEFPAPEGGIVSVRYPIVFTPDG
jgi:hypothetical protein